MRLYQASRQLMQRPLGGRSWKGAKLMVYRVMFATPSGNPLTGALDPLASIYTLSLPRWMQVDC